MFLAAVYLLRLSKRWPRVPDDPAIGRAFGWTNAIQWIAVAIAAFSFAKLHIDAYVISAIAAMVGLHLLSPRAALSLSAALCDGKPVGGVGLSQRFLRPAFRIGLGGIEEEAVVGSQHVWQ